MKIIMENEEKKVKRSSLPIAILLASIVVGGFYYASQIKKQESIERQQQIKIEQERSSRSEKEKEVAMNSRLLDTCMTNALSTNVNFGKKILQMYDECKVQSGGNCRTAEAYNDALKENELQLQKEQDLCLRRYTQ